MIRNVTTSDAPEISAIYNHYVKNTIVTFEENPVSVEEMQTRIAEISKDYPWVVYVHGGKVVGYAYASRWKSRCSYQYSVECTVYLEKSMTGQGIGKTLFETLLKEIAARGMHSAIGGVALPNPASVGLLEKFGFEKIGHFEEVGRKFDQWIDVGYWELIFKK